MTYVHINLDWKELDSGNWLAEHEWEPVTVFPLRNGMRAGQWSAIHKSRILRSCYETPEDAIAAVEKSIEDSDRWSPLDNDTGWRPYKSKHVGSWRRDERGRVFAVRRAKSGKYYAVENGEIIAGQWFDTEEEARRFLDLSG